MRRFLQETWELWYWAMFCPSRLQQRMDAWCSKEGKIAFSDILLFSINWRFLAQFLSLIGCLSIPLVMGLAQSPILLDWWLLPLTALIAYGVAFWFLPVALPVPLVIGFLYGTDPQAWRAVMQAGWQALESDVLPFRQLALGFGTGSLLLGLTTAFIYGLLKQQHLAVAKVVCIAGSSGSIVIGSWIATQSLLFAAFIGLIMGLVSLVTQSYLSSSNDAFVVAFVAAVVVAAVVAVVVAGSVAFGVAVGVVFVVAVVVAVVVAIISQLALLPFLAVATGLAFSCAYARNRWLGLWVGVIFVALGAANLGWQVAWVLPITCGFYYRWLPDYLVFAPLSTIASFNLSLVNRNFSQNSSSQIAKSAEKWLKRLPPFSSELLWLTLPGHARLLAKVFQNNPALGLSTLEKMQVSPLPGLTRTAQNALPDIVSQELLKFDNLEQIQSIGLVWERIDSNQTLRILLPRYFEVTLRPGQIEPPVPQELSIIFPRFQKISEDISAIRQSNEAALRQRGLERVLEQLQTLQAQLPGLGLKSQAIRRWQPVIIRWQNLLELELELEKRRRLTQRDLLNPFHYGNPLKLKQGDLFKGRQGFADNIVRLLLDRNRPTIILHGPRRCGKTSFLKNLPRLLPRDWVPIFIDMQSAAATADEISFLRNLARSIRRDGRSQGIRILDEPDRAAFQTAPYDTFETWLEKVLEELGNRQLLLNLDEFEKIGVAINQGKLSLSLFDELRSLIQHWDQLGFIFSGVQTLDEIGPNWSSYFISVVPVEMLYLEPHEARDLLTNPDPEFALTYAPGLVDDILHLTQCHPNLLQLIGAALVAEANAQHTSIATATMLEAAIPNAFTLGTSYFTNVWEEFTGDLAQPAEIRAGQRLLKALAEGSHPPDNLDAASQAALRRMVRYHVLKQTQGQYQFEIPLIQRWVRERAILSDEG